MSDFTVLVIGDDFEQQLAPYHEFECTGRDDEYVQDIDKTEEARAEFESDTSVVNVELATGVKVCAYDDRFYRDPTPEESRKFSEAGTLGSVEGISYHRRDWGDGRGYRPKVRYVPEGWEHKKLPTAEIESFAKFVGDYYGWAPVPHGEEPDIEDTHKYGYVLLDEKGDVLKCVDRTNPNAKWDWYRVGGRWRGFFPLKPDTTGDLGAPGTFESLGMSEGRPDYAKERLADHVRAGDVDFERARDRAEREARAQFDRWRPLFQKHGKPKGWAEIREVAEAKEKALGELSKDATEEQEREHSLQIRKFFDDAREVYHEQKVIKLAKEELKMYLCPVDEYGFDEEAYAQKARDAALVPFAIVKDGKWYGKGEMGWFGMSYDEKNTNDWNAEVQRLYDDLPPDTMLTLVDCHI